MSDATQTGDNNARRTTKTHVRAPAGSRPPRLSHDLADATKTSSAQLRFNEEISSLSSSSSSHVIVVKEEEEARYAIAAKAFVPVLEMASEDDDEARHAIVAEEEKEAGYAIVVKAKEVAEAGSATVT